MTTHVGCATRLNCIEILESMDKSNLLPRGKELDTKIIVGVFKIILKLNFILELDQQ